MKAFRVRKTAVSTGVALALFSVTAFGIPELQLYVEGATYDGTTETWVFDASSGDPFRIWAIGAVGDAGQTINDVRISIAYPSQVADPAFVLTPSTTGNYGNFTDPSTPSDPAFVQRNTSGDAPTLTDGTSLPTHSVYGAGTDWTEFLLGDFSLTDSPVADFVTSFPSPHPTKVGQINVYELTYTGLEGGTLHFDLYNNVFDQQGDVKAINAPFSHDAAGSSGGGSNGGGGSSGGSIPEPGSPLALMALGGFIMLLTARGRFLRR